MIANGCRSLGCAALSVAVALGSVNAQRSSESSGSAFTGTFAYTTRRLPQAGTPGCWLEAAPVARDSLYVQMLCRYPAPGHHLGVLEARLPIRGDSVMYEQHRDSSDPCRIRMRFQGERAIVTQEGSDLACGFGAYVNVGGTYDRLSRGHPPFDLAPVERSALVRQQANVRVGDVLEQWRLEWRSQPTPVCMGAEALTCPCSGFGYGESGPLRLVRHRRFAPEESLDLDRFFGQDDGPVDSAIAVLQRWPVLSGDYTAKDTAELVRRVRRRAPASVMSLGDYDHDGRATEFLLQIGEQPCGKRDDILIGVSMKEPELHAFVSVGHPDRPLVLEARAWAALLRATGPVTVVESPCGDHGGDTQDEVTVEAKDGEINGRRMTYACNADGTRGKLVSSEPI